MSTESAALATQDSYRDAVKTSGDEVKLWLDAIDIASNEEKDWRTNATKAVNLYRQHSDAGSESYGAKKFNILHANIQTIIPALYNSTPVPDVRRRNNDPDPIAKIVADVQERAISYSIDAYDFDQCVLSAATDMELAGRGQTRVRYLPYLDKEDNIADQQVLCEHVQWKHFRRGPGNTWDDVPWIAFELFLTRDQLLKLSPDKGEEVNLDTEVTGTPKENDGRNTPEVFKRARVWEIWDKDRRQVLFIATGYKDEPIRVEPDPLELIGFFPTPRPLYGVQTSDNLVPIVPYEIYKAQAEELERVSRRIEVLTEAMKARSVHDGRMTELNKLMDEDDAASVPIENIGVYADGSKLSDHVYFWPIEVIAVALEKLYLAREQIKATIYEITGISDILRGDTDAGETLGAQQIKTQWGSLRIQRKQQEIQRFARDLFRIKAELFASKFQPEILEMMTGIPLAPKEGEDPQQSAQKQQVLQLLKSDTMRGFRIDVESDSTIRADMTRNQQNMTNFLAGTGQFAQSMGPIVMQFPALTGTVMEVFSAFARNFKLGRQAEAALDTVADQAKQMAQQPKPPSPEEEAAKAELQMKQQQMQMDAQAQAKKQEMDQAAQGQQMQMDQQKHEQEMAFKQQEHADSMNMERERMMMERDNHQMTMQMDMHKHEQSMQAQGEQHAQGMELERMKFEAQPGPDGKPRPPLPQQASTTKQISQAIEAISAVGKAVMQIGQKVDALGQEVVQISQDMSAPVQVDRGPDKRIAQIRKGRRTIKIQRGPDNRMVGLQ